MNTSPYLIIDDVEIPSWLVDSVFCEPNKDFIYDEKINQFADETLLPLAQHHPLAESTTHIYSNHVHIGTIGLEPHNHLPHRLTSVLYLEDAVGTLMFDIDGKTVRITPRKGRYVIFTADLMHSVEPSPIEELRIALVTNYD